LTKNRSERPYARQSSRRRSSPGTYLRYSANSTLDPRCGLGCRPETEPSIGFRANSGKPASRDRTAISRKLRDWRSGNIRGSGSVGWALPTGERPTHSPRESLVNPRWAVPTLPGSMLGVRLLDESTDDLLGVDALGLCGEGRDEAVSEHGEG